MSKTSIEWTDHTWNPIRGCKRISEGCRHCYAESIAARFSCDRKLKDGSVVPGTFAGFAIMTDSGPRWTGKVALMESKLHEPLYWRKPRRAFISMSDPWHEDLEPGLIAQVYAVMAYAQKSTFQILTKRPEYRRACFETRFESLVMKEFAALMAMHGPPRHPSPWRWPLPNVHEGVSVENAETAERRVRHLLDTPAARRFVSYEPALEDVGFERLFQLRPGVNQVIIGGESGPQARPFRFEWARRLVKAGRRYGVAVFVKQLGARPVGETEADILSLVNLNRKGSNFEAFPPDLQIRELIA